VYLAGGEADTLARAEPLQKTLGAAVHHVGPIGAGAQTKLATNALLGMEVAALAELIGLLKRGNADPARVLAAIADTSVWAPVNHYLAGSMLRGEYQPQFPLELIEKDFGYAVRAAGGAEHAPTLAAVWTVFQAGIAQGLAEENMTALAKLFA
jgi:3-hydroxyisobutyrate dehydrogenase